MLSNVLLVAFGAGFGVFARVMCSNWIIRKNKGSFPLATFSVNMIGSLVLGMATGYGLNESYSLLIGTGFLGSFTTFSTFQVENVELLRGNEFLLFLFYLGSSCVLGMTLLFIGVLFGEMLG